MSRDLEPPLEWAVLECLRDPLTYLYPPVIEIAGQVFDTEAPTETQLATFHRP
jgi:hypothetical protein